MWSFFCESYRQECHKTREGDAHSHLVAPPVNAYLKETGYDNDSIEDFYAALREEIDKGRIREDRLSESNVILEAVKP